MERLEFMEKHGSVANPPCGVETLASPMQPFQHQTLLIHRVELKPSDTPPKSFFPILVANPPCGVETLIRNVAYCFLQGVANPPCGVETS